MAWAAVLLLGELLFWGVDALAAETIKARYLIVASDTILSTMAEALLPPDRYSIEAILPPGQCPGHYDVKLSDIEKMQKADLVISFRGMPFLEKVDARGRNRLLIDNGRRNWMAPDSYIHGLNRLAGDFVERFPKDRDEINQRKDTAIRLIRDEALKLKKRVDRAGITDRAVLASSLQKEPLEWMGLRVVGEYGRPESLSVKDVVRLVKIGRNQHVVAVVDNLQSGPEAGKHIAETLGRPHVVITNFPTARGYLATLQDNVYAVLAALENK